MIHEFQIDTSAWTQTQKNHVVAAVSHLLDSANVLNFTIEQPFDGSVVRVNTDSEIPGGTITTQTVLAKIQEFETGWAQAAAERQALEDEANNEILGNQIQTISIAEANAWIDAQYAPIESALSAASNLAQAKTALLNFIELDKTIKKKIAKYIIAKEIQRGQR